MNNTILQPLKRKWTGSIDKRGKFHWGIIHFRSAVITLNIFNKFCHIFYSSVFKKEAEEKGFAQYDELDEYYGEPDEYNRPDNPEGKCPKWCLRCPAEKVFSIYFLISQGK